MTTYPLDPELAAGLAMFPQGDGADLAAGRAALNEMVALMNAGVDTEGVEITEHLVPGPEGAPDVRLMAYVPEGAEGPLPVVYDIHGGGFMTGTPELDHTTNVAISRELRAAVFSVDYRLAPEHPYPAGLEDCYAGLTWVAKNAAELGVDVGRIAIYGQSAGGGLVAALALLARDRGGPALCFQYLGVPELDDRLTTPSMQAFTDTPAFSRPGAVVSWDAYLGAGVPGTDGVPLYAAPARGTTADLEGLPPAYIAVMEFDPLRDEGIDYARALLAAGVSVELHLFPATFHGSALIRTAEVSQRETAELRAVLGRALR
ncbi:alpha/beta hydrolase [Streptomyces sp. NPDC002920]